MSTYRQFTRPIIFRDTVSCLANTNTIGSIFTSGGNVVVTGDLTTGNINITGNLFQGGEPYIASQWTTNTIGATNSIFYTSGNVGIGTTIPAFTLDINGNTCINNGTSAAPIMSLSGGDGSRIVLTPGVESTTAPYAIGIETNNMWFSSGGGEFKWYDQFASPVMSLSGNELITVGDVTCFGSISDRNLKTNVESILCEAAFDVVRSLRPVTFNWREDIFNIEKRGKSDVGFIAQEVENVIPFAVGEYKELQSGTVYKNMKHERIIPYLVSAIQKLIDENERLNKRLNDLVNI